MQLMYFFTKNPSSAEPGAAAARAAAACDAVS